MVRKVTKIQALYRAYRVRRQIKEDKEQGEFLGDVSDEDALLLSNARVKEVF